MKSVNEKMQEKLKYRTLDIDILNHLVHIPEKSQAKLRKTTIMTIKTSLFRAARALLNWSQKDLAERAGVSDVSIINYETGKRTPQQNTLERIQQAFELAGVSFTKHGLELKEDVITIIEGENWYLRLLDDVYYHLIDEKDAELIIMFSDDKVSPPEANDRYRKIRNAGIRMRQLVEEGNTYLMGPLKEYRYLPSSKFTNYVSLIYGDRLAVCTDDNTKAVIFKDPRLTQAWTYLIGILWDVLPQPEESTANERF